MEAGNSPCPDETNDVNTKEDCIAATQALRGAGMKIRYWGVTATSDQAKKPKGCYYEYANLVMDKFNGPSYRAYFNAEAQEEQDNDAHQYRICKKGETQQQPRSNCHGDKGIASS